jgi:KEOPS complex subunit Cgi121
MKLVEGVVEIEDLGAFLDALDAVADAHGVTVQAFDARYVVDREHLRRAVELADRAFERGENIARERGVEILLFAAGRRQINRALEIGVDEGRNEVVVLVDGGPSEDVSPDDSSGGDPLEGDSSGGDESSASDGAPARSAVESAEAAAVADVADLLEPTATLGRYDAGRVREFYDVGDAELAAVDGDLADLVRERVALLVVER